MRVVVIGAGAFGGWTALESRRAGADVVLIDAWGPGNARSSSGGESRVLRGIYGADRIYTEWVRRAVDAWRTLESETGRPLYVETGCLWLIVSDDAYVRAALPALEAFGLVAEEVALDVARGRWPMVSFDGLRTVWFEHTAGALSAREACAAVRDRFVELGGRYVRGRVNPPRVAGPLGSVAIESGEVLEADRFVFACGPWLGTMFPDVLGDAIRPSRQEILYFGTPPGDDRYSPRRMPAWLEFGDRIVYGLPDVHGRGVKVADDTRGPAFDPDRGDRVPTSEGIAGAREALARRFPGLRAAPLLESRVCQYENSPDGQLIVDRHPHAENVWLIGGGSGHGFKLGPALGAYATRALLNDATLDPRWSLGRLADAPAKTQFD